MSNKAIKVIQKGLTIASIAGVGVIVLMLILSLLIKNLKLFEEDFVQGIFLSVVVITAAVYFCSNALSIIKQRKILAYISLGLLGLSLILALICFWYMWGVPLYNKEVGKLARDVNEGFGKFTGIMAIFTILFVIIVNSYTKLGKKLLPFQIITYVFVLTIDIILTLAIMGVEVFKNSGFVTIFVILCLITFALMCVVNILAAKHYRQTLIDTSEKVDNDEYITIKRSEYEALLNKIKELEK